jgi:hypothetical protein
VKGAIATAWLFAMGLVSYRFIVKRHQPPIPGSLLAASGTFALLGLVSEYGPAAPAAALAAWGFDLAALLGLFPDSVFPSGKTTSAAGAYTGPTVSQQVLNPPAQAGQ